MSTYRIQRDYISDGRQALVSKLRLKYTLLITILCAAVALSIWHTLGPREEFHVATYIIGLSALTAIVIVSLRDTWARGVRHLNETVDTYRLTVEPGRILCVHNHSRPIMLDTSEILRVQEDGRHGLHLCTRDPKLCIVIPPQLENFQACKAELRAQGLSWEAQA
jgi:hypothetical protein